MLHIVFDMGTLSVRTRRTRRHTKWFVPVLAVTVIAATLAISQQGQAKTLHHDRVEQWRPLVEKYWTAYGYADEIDFALMVMFGESTGVPTAQHPGSLASGLFQHLPKYWADRSAAAGWAGANIFDPEANIAVAAWLRATSPEHGWRHWEATHVWYPPGSFGANTYWDGGRYANMGDGHVSVGGAYENPNPTEPPPAMTISKTSSVEGDPPEFLEGTDVVWTYEVINTGDVDLWALYLWDDALGEVVCPDDHLAPGGSTVCIAAEISELGVHEARVLAFAWDDDGREASASANGAYFGIPPAELQLEARIDGYPADESGPVVVSGDEVLVSYHLTNAGDVDIYALYIWDDALGELTCPKQDLRPGDSVICTATLIADLDETESGHLGWVWGWTAAGNQIETSDPMSYRVVEREVGPSQSDH